MNRQEEIILHLESVDQLVEPFAPSPFLKRRLRKDAEKFIIEKATTLSAKSGAKLIFYLPESIAAAARDLPAAFHQEGLAILAWIALWRPGELLLYEWYPFKRDAKLFGKLERAEMQVIAEAKEASR